MRRGSVREEQLIAHLPPACQGFVGMPAQVCDPLRLTSRAAKLPNGLGNEAFEAISGRRSAMHGFPIASKPV